MKKKPLNPELPLPRLVPRAVDAHKGDFGTALIVGGSRGMSGAAALAGMAALRGGAGLVRVAVPDACLDTVAAFEPCYTTIPLPCDASGRITCEADEKIFALAADAAALAIGPGLGRSLDLDRLLPVLYRELAIPMVIDADGLNALAAHPKVLAQPNGPRILTPHPGEFATLIGKKLENAARRNAAIRLAEQSGVTVLLKGHRTLITDGLRRTLNATGNPGMATGGSGDVLTGLIVALLCQKLEAFDAARLAAHLHGLAGDLAADDLGRESLIARDLIDYLPRAMRHFAKSEP